MSHGDLNTNPLSISCIFKAKPIAPITWTYIDDGTVMNLPEAVTTTDTDTTVDRVYTQTTSTLSWHPAVAPDNDKRRRAGGTYKCQAGNNNGIKNSQEMMLTIYCKLFQLHIFSLIKYYTLPRYNYCMACIYDSGVNKRILSVAMCEQNKISI